MLECKNDLISRLFVNRNDWVLQRIPIEESVIHPRYNSNGRNENDIALLRLSRPASLSASVLPAILPLDESAVARDIGVTNIRYASFHFDCY